MIDTKKFWLNRPRPPVAQPEKRSAPWAKAIEHVNAEPGLARTDRTGMKAETKSESVWDAAIDLVNRSL